MVVYARSATRRAYSLQVPRSIRAATAARDLQPSFLLTRLSPAFCGALTAPPDSRETPKFTNPIFREETITKEKREEKVEKEKIRKRKEKGFLKKKKRKKEKKCDSLLQLDTNRSRLTTMCVNYQNN